MKVLHAADLHIDSPLRGLERYEGAPVDALRLATRRAFQQLVGFCVEQSVELLLIAGDLFDDDWRDYSSGLFFCAELVKLRDAGVRVVFIRGNHDAASKVSRRLSPPSNVRELSFRRPETIVFDELGIAVHGQGFATAAVTEDLAASYPAPVAGLINFGLLHTSVDGREGHAPYAPCRLGALVNQGYDYWALGHVHRHEVLSADPWVVFPGNLQGRHARETGPKGASLVSIEEGRIACVEQIVFDVVRWQRCVVDVKAAVSPEDVIDLVRIALDGAAQQAGDRLLAARVVIEGATRAHAALVHDSERWVEQVRAEALELSGGVWIEKVVLTTEAPLDHGALRSRDDAVGQLVRTFSQLRTDAAALGELLHELSDLKQKLPPELRRAPEALDLDDPTTLVAVIDDVERLVLPRLLALEEP